ncbi:nucleotidyltransferase domain-containing protein [Singulisphaera rosea]
MICEGLEPFHDRIVVAFVHGSFARHAEHPGSDIDLMIIGRIGLAELATTLEGIEKTILRPVNPSLYSPEEIAEKLASGHHFLSTVMSQEKLFVIGGKAELAVASERKPRSAAPDKQAGA